jgi:hypothetical protein
LSGSWFNQASGFAGGYDCLEQAKDLDLSCGSADYNLILIMEERNAPSYIITQLTGEMG